MKNPRDQFRLDLIEYANRTNGANEAINLCRRVAKYTLEDARSMFRQQIETSNIIYVHTDPFVNIRRDAGSISGRMNV